MSDGPPFAVAVEGGGTKTVAVAVRRDGEAVAWGRGGSSLTLHVGEERARASVLAAVDALMPHVAASQVGAVAVAMVGRGYSFAPRVVLGERFPVAMVREIDEGDAALLGATLSSSGVVVLSGTGSFARAVGEGGRAAQVGGNGPLVGDEGSAHYLAVEAIRRALWAEDGRGESTELGALLCERFGLTEPKDISRRLYGPDAPDRDAVASLAPLVTEAAARGDPVAGRVLEAAASHLAAMARAAMARVTAAGDGWTDDIPLGCSGGVLLNAPALRELVVREVCPVDPRLRPVGPHLPPIGGTALAALRAMGCEPDLVAGRLMDSLPDELGRPRPADESSA